MIQNGLQIMAFKEIKMKKNKYDFLAINQHLNNNFNGKSFFGIKTKLITKGEELKIKRLFKGGKK